MKILSLFIFKLHKLTMFQSFLAKKKMEIVPSLSCS